MTAAEEIQKILDSPEGTHVEFKAASKSHKGRPLVPRRSKTQFRPIKTQFRRNPMRKCLTDSRSRRRGIARKPEHPCQGCRRPGHLPAAQGGPRI